MEITPGELFNKWYKEELILTKLSIPSACCLPTIGTDKYPNARFVSLKEVIENKFLITGTITSQKGIEIKFSNKVALTFWWTETERQVRIQGNAFQINNDLADKFFAERSRESQIVSIVSDQGHEVNDSDELYRKYDDIAANSANEPLKRPANWSGYMIEPVRVEFMEFKSTRFHYRKLFELINDEWKQTELQP